ncbi:hypothetical protein [Actinacidiphila acidipaludis]|uniref:Large membrane protein n=1 Tax=Actinacidiphila acidipaludis TaxID=2873382 RepID=A0ABS7Q046_9ACTN|nr:hypothetical protein [Streptomyces acidipaludis]MBY8876507.1 hypothetical protein [Streptomyces acidipaludis]
MSTERHDQNSDEPSHDPGQDAAQPAAADRGGDTAREHPQDRPAHRSRLTVAAVAAAVLLAGGGGAYWAAASGGGGDDAKASQSAPQPLRFDGPGVSASVSGDSASGTSPADSGDTYQLTGTLPGGPSSAPVWKPSGGIDQAAVQHLATVLGVSGPVTTVGGTWRVGGTVDGGGPSLMVGKDAPGSWVYTRFGAPPTMAHPDRTIQQSGGGTMAPSGGSTGSPGSPGNSNGSDSSGDSSSSNSSSSGTTATTGSTPPVSEQAALRSVQPLLAGLGLSGARTDASRTVGSLRTVEADPVLGGLPTHGWATTAQVGADGRITLANGRLSPLGKGATYPVVSAAAALKELNAGAVAHPDGPTSCRLPVPTMTPLAPGTSGNHALPRTVPCLPRNPHPVQVRGASFGLSTQFVNGTQTLVPSWLFDTAQAGVKATSVVAQPAVDPKYITSGGGVTSVPVTPVNPGGPVRTGPGQPADPRAPHPVEATAYQAKGSTLTLVFWGGLCGTYHGSADETATQVKVRVSEEPAKPGKVCPMIEKTLTVQVTLKQPLGSRTVVDATDGQPVRGQ